MTDVGRVQVSGNSITDTILNTANATYQASDNSINIWGNGSDVTTLDYYISSSSDATRNGGALEASIMSDYDTANPNYQVNASGTHYVLDAAGNKILDPREPLNLQDFTWTDELADTIESLGQTTSRLKFEKQTSADADTDLTVSMGSYDPSKPNPTDPTAQQFFDPGGEGEGVFPGNLPKGTGSATHLAVNGDLAYSGSAEVGGAAYRGWIVSHELGHSLGLSHPHQTRAESASLNARFPADFALNNERYTVMSYQGATPLNTPLNGSDSYGHSVGYMAVDQAALQQLYGIGDNNTGNTTYNLTDGAQITDPKSNNAALDIDGADESRAELTQAYTDAAKSGGVWEGIKAYGAKVSEQLKSGRFDGGEESIGRAYKTIYDGEREVDAAGKESVGNGGIDEISYAGSQQSAMINLNDAGLGADQTDAQYLDLQREIKGSGRWSEFNTELQNEIDATVNDTTGGLRSDAYSAGGHFSKLYVTDATTGKVTATQDGGYSIANGVVIENATGGDKADTLIGNEHDNVLTGNKGADALYGGHGNDTLIGGDGNDALVAGRGNNTLDGGADFDTASYKELYDPSVAIPITQGVSFSITGNQATVTKPLNGAVAGPASASVETDNIQNVERFEGSGRDDVFTVENLAGNMYISGGAGNDTLTVKDPTGAYSLDMTGGTYSAGHPRAGETYTGTVSDGTNTIYLKDDDLNVKIETPPPPTPEISLQKAVEILAEDQKVLNRQAEETGVSSPAHEAVNHPDAVQMIENLHVEGVSTLKVELTSDMGPEERVGNILVAGKEATQEAGLSMPHEQSVEAAQIEEASMQPQHIPEPAYEDDYSYSL